MAAGEAAADSMQDTESTARDIRQPAALCRYGVIADLLTLPTGSHRLAEGRRARAAQAHVIPDSLRTRAAESTIRDWMAAYRRSGFRALRAKPRDDRGWRRGLDPQVAEALLALKERYPRRSVRLIIQRALASDRVPDGTVLAPSTVYRLFSGAGLTGRGVPEDAVADRRRFAFRDAGEPWMLSVPAPRNLLYFRELGDEQVPVAVCCCPVRFLPAQEIESWLYPCGPKHHPGPSKRTSTGSCRPTRCI